MPARRPPPLNCPVCGEDVPRQAQACPECGACYESGWRTDRTDEGALGLQDYDFDYDEFVAEEFGHPPKRTSLQWVWWLTAVVLLGLMVVGYLTFHR